MREGSRGRRMMGRTRFRRRGSYLVIPVWVKLRDLHHDYCLRGPDRTGFLPRGVVGSTESPGDESDRVRGSHPPKIHVDHPNTHYHLPRTSNRPTDTGSTKRDPDKESQ